MFFSSESLSFSAVLFRVFIQRCVILRGFGNGYSCGRLARNSVSISVVCGFSL